MLRAHVRDSQPRNDKFLIDDCRLVEHMDK